MSVVWSSFLFAIFSRDLAPHLKLLIGPWWFSQFDSINEVSQAAKRSFQVALKWIMLITYICTCFFLCYS